MKRVLLLFSACAAVGLAQQDNKLPIVPRELLGKAIAPAAASKTEAAAVTTVSGDTVIGDSYEVQVTSDNPITIQPDQFYFLPQSKLDFTSAAHANIAVTSVGQDLTGLRILSAWAAQPPAGKGEIWFNITDISQKFALLDHGGLSTPVFGPVLKVALYNGSTVPLTVKQVSIYATK
uniref:Uncharacterized protein n=1 Tax=Solibacter usitatus (strain Ellin6076) TaxID=234267 RepID=Q01TR4_SOLUE